jgi:hypothetical protein
VLWQLSRGGVSASARIPTNCGVMQSKAGLGELRWCMERSWMGSTGGGEKRRREFGGGGGNGDR